MQNILQSPLGFTVAAVDSHFLRFPDQHVGGLFDVFQQVELLCGKEIIQARAVLTWRVVTGATWCPLATFYHISRVSIASWRISFLVFKTPQDVAQTLTEPPSVPLTVLRIHDGSDVTVPIRQTAVICLSSPGNLILSLQCTRINCGDTWNRPCLGFGCDLISSHPADYLALVHRVNCDIANSDCLHVPRGYLRKGVFWFCPAAAPVVAGQGDHASENKNLWNLSKNAK